MAEQPGTAVALGAAGRRMLLGFAVWTVYYTATGAEGRGGLAEAVDWWMVILTVGAFLRGYAALAGGEPGGAELRRVVSRFALAWGVLLVVVPPQHSTDLHDYVNHGWMQAHYGLSPYACATTDVPGWQADPMFRRTVWVGWGAPYGFLFTAATKWMALAGCGNRWVALRIFKAVNLLLLWAAAGGMAWLLRRLGRDDVERGRFLVLWNPLLLAHLIGNGHNDGWTALFGVFGGAAVAGGLAVWVLPLLTLSAMVKYASLVVMPFAGLYVGRRCGWWRLAAGAALSAALVAGLAWPYTGGSLHASSMVSNATQATRGSLFSLLYFPLSAAHSTHHMGLQTARLLETVLKCVFGAGFLCFAGRLWLRRARRPDRRETLLEDLVVVQFVLVFVASSKFHPWYLGMVLPMVGWLPARHWLSRAAVVLTCSEMLSFTFLSTADAASVILIAVLPLVWLFLGWPRWPKRPAWLLPEADGEEP